MTDIKRDWVADRAICDAATAGPWDWCACGDYVSITNDTEIVVDDSGVIMRPDSKFITEARTGWPAALDEIARLRDVISGVITLVDNGYLVRNKMSLAVDVTLRRAREALRNESETSRNMGEN